MKRLQDKLVVALLCLCAQPPHPLPDTWHLGPSLGLLNPPQERQSEAQQLMALLQSEKAEAEAARAAVIPEEEQVKEGVGYGLAWPQSTPPWLFVWEEERGG